MTTPAINAAAAAVISASSGGGGGAAAAANYQQGTNNDQQQPAFAPEMVLALRNQASLLHKQSNFEAAIARFSEAISVFDKCCESSSNAVSASAASPITLSDANKQQIHDLLSNKKRSRATLLALRSLSYLKRGDAHEALHDANESIQLDPQQELGHMRFVDANLSMANYKMASDVARARIMALEACARRVEAEMLDIEQQQLEEEEDDGDDGDDDDDAENKIKKQPLDAESKNKMNQELQRRNKQLEREMKELEAQLDSYNTVLERCYDEMSRTGQLPKPTSIKVSALASKAIRAQAEAMGQKVEKDEKKKQQTPDDYCSHGGPAPSPALKTFIGDWFRSGSGTLVQRAMTAFEKNPNPVFWGEMSRACISLAATAVIFEDANDQWKFVRAALMCRLLLKDGVLAVKEYLDEDFKVDEKKAPALAEEVEKLKKSSRYLIDFVKRSIPCHCLDKE